MVSCSKKVILVGIGVVLLVGVIVGVAVYFSTSSSVSPQPQVTVEQGQLLGKWIQGYDTKFVAFLGVPYAAPPVGELRFKAPRAPSKWSGVRNAQKEADQCFQGVGGTTAAVNSEDCLYLNVFTPRLPETNNEKLPVYLFVHGGGFALGSSNMMEFGPDFLIAHDIVIVTIQYRLSAFGFASLDNEVIPGNGGIKDAMAALQWVHKNIAQFGGDPQRITVGGQSAGSVTASWLTALPESRGLLAGAILQSGTALHSWGYKEDHIERTIELASRISQRQVNTIDDASSILMNAPAAIIASESEKLSLDNTMSAPELIFQPSPERRTVVREPAIITRDAESYFLNRSVPYIPQMIGNVNMEQRVDYYGLNPDDNPENDQNLLDNLITRFPKNIIPFSDTRRLLGIPDDAQCDYNLIVNEMRKAIVEAANASCNLTCLLKEHIDDVFFIMDTQRLALWRLSHSEEPTYLFRFAVNTELNLPWPKLPIPSDEKNGALHTDDLHYLWHMTTIKQYTKGSGVIPTTMRRMTTMWANFVKYGKPIIEKTDDLPVDWLPNKVSDSGLEVTFLEIGEELSMRTGNLAGRLYSTWDRLYKMYRQENVYRLCNRTI